MRGPSRPTLAGILTLGVALAFCTSSASAQGVGGSATLGGYGASMRFGVGSMGGPIVPYAGKFGGFMPSRMGGGGGDLSFQRRPPSTMSPIRPSFSLSTMSEGMTATSGGMGRGPGSSGMSATPGLGGGMRLGGGTSPAMPGGMGVMPPRIGYPFRQPPSLVGPASGSGMPM